MNTIILFCSRYYANNCSVQKYNLSNAFFGLNISSKEFLYDGMRHIKTQCRSLYRLNEFIMSKNWLQPTLTRHFLRIKHNMGSRNPSL